MTDLPLEAATKDVIARYNKGNDMLVSAAVALRRLKERVDAGEAGQGVSWAEYRHTHLEPHMSRQWLNTQLRLAPPGATEGEVEKNVVDRRRINREEVRQHRARNGATGTYVSSGGEIANQPDPADDSYSARLAASRARQDTVGEASARGVVNAFYPVTDPLASLKTAFLTLDGRARYAFREWVNGQLPLAPTSSQPPTPPKPPTDKMPKILAALDAAGTVGLTVGELYNKAGAYLTDLDLAGKQGLIREAGEK